MSHITSGHGSTIEPDDQAFELKGIVVYARGNTVSIYNAWIHQRTKKDIVDWEGQDAYGTPLRAGNWVTMVWRRERVTKVTLFEGEPPMPVRQCTRTGDVLLQTDLSLKEPDAGKRDKQLWSEEFRSVGLLNYANIKDMIIGGETKKMWIVWMMDTAERDKHLQRTGYDVVWKVAFDQGEQMYANGRQNEAEDSGVASLVTPIQSDSSGETEKLSHSDRVRLKGSFPGNSLNRVGIITGQQPGTPTYYVWSPGAPPMMEGRLVAHRKNGQERLHICDWVHFRVNESDEDTYFKNKQDHDRFTVQEWEQVDGYFPTQLSPNKQTIEVAIRKMVMTLENTKKENGEVFYEDQDFGWIGDRNNMFLNDYPISEGNVIEFEGVIRRVKPRYPTDSPWMILKKTVNYKGKMKKDDRKKKDERPPEEELRPHYYEERRDDYRSNERDERREDTRGGRDHYLLEPPRHVGKVQGDVVESTAFVEGLGTTEAYVWLIDVAASGVINGGAKYLDLGDVVYAKFRYQNNGKWGAMGVAKPDELPQDLHINVKRGKVYVTTKIIYVGGRKVYHNPWFETVLDMENRMSRNPMDKEVHEVELTKTRNGFNVNKFLS